MIKKNAGLIFFVLWLVSCASVSAQQPVGLGGIGDTYYPQWGNSGYDALHYLLDLSVNVNSNFISGTTVMRAQATQPLTSFNLDFRGLTIDDVMVNDKPAQYNRAGRELTIMPAELLAAGQTFTVTVQYKGTPEPFVAETDQQYPILIGWMHSANNIFVLNEPIGAESWYPVNNHPLDKATYTFHITVPKPYVVAANGLLLTTEDHGNSLTYIWESKYPMASYLTMLDIGEFTVETKTGPNDLPIRNYLIPGRADELSDNLKLTGEMIRFFNEAFGPYPFEAYGAVVIDKNAEGFTGLETQTLSMLLQEGTIPQEVIAHELAHQWFGDSVSLKDWQDVWLKEGFANYAEWLWLEHNEGRKVVDQKVRDLWLERSFEDAPPGTPPADNLYHGSVYVRGAMTLHALRLRLGDETFFRILHTYTDRYRYSNASTADFIAVAEEVSGQTLTQFFNDWLYTKHLPDIPEIGLTQ